MKKITVLIPTYERPTALAALLTSLCFQEYNDFNIAISDQSENHDVVDHPTIQTLFRILKLRKHTVRFFKNLPRKGIAHQRQFLLNHSHTQYSLFLDDDVILEPYVIGKMYQAIREEHCGFVGSAVQGLSFMYDKRPHEESIEFWSQPVQPEKVVPYDCAWNRHKLHNAANLFHVKEKLNLTPNNQKKYKVAWVGGCVIYDTEKLKSVGGFSFWKKLPKNHCGEDVLAQLSVMERYGGCGLIPSGVYHQELPTTIQDRTINAPEYILK